MQEVLTGNAFSAAQAALETAQVQGRAAASELVQVLNTHAQVALTSDTGKRATEMLHLVSSHTNEAIQTARVNLQQVVSHPQVQFVCFCHCAMTSMPSNEWMT